MPLSIDDVERIISSGGLVASVGITAYMHESSLTASLSHLSAANEKLRDSTETKIRFLSAITHGFSPWLLLTWLFYSPEGATYPLPPLVFARTAHALGRDHWHGQ